MRPKKPKVCDACLEEDELIWDKKRKEWLCELCIEYFNNEDEMRKEALRHKE